MGQLEGLGQKQKKKRHEAKEHVRQEKIEKRCPEEGHRKQSAIKEKNETKVHAKREKEGQGHPRKGQAGAKRAVLENRGEASKYAEQEGKKNAKCPYAKKCGSCALQGVPYQEQLQQKQKTVAKLFEGIVKPAPIIGMEDPYHYRNKVHAVFGYAGKGEVISGTYQAGTHKLVPIASCQIEDEKADEIIGSIRTLLRSFKIKTYDEDTGYGLLRHVLVRCGRKSGQYMVVLVLASPILPGKNNFVKALRELHPEITTIVLNINDKQTSMVLGERNIVLYGRGVIEDELCGLRFLLSPNSFYQINPVQTEKLYRTAIDFAGLTGTERVIDAYCGIGTIGLSAASAAGEVIGVELNQDAVRDAKENARRNQVKNARFYQQDASLFLKELAEAGERADVLLMDPPRVGSDTVFLGAAVRLAPKRIVYISCNPETQVRDVRFFLKHGYAAVRMQPVDMFPFCSDVENIVLLEKK